MNRLQSFKKQNTSSSDTTSNTANSNNWANDSSDEDFENVPVSATEMPTKSSVPAPGHELRREEDPANERLAVDPDVAAKAKEEGLKLRKEEKGKQAERPVTPLTTEEEDTVNMPGSFYIKQQEGHHTRNENHWFHKLKGLLNHSG